VQDSQVTIIGGGLAGLYAANQLASRKISYQLFDVKPVFGGRIAGIPSASDAAQFYDLGPAWVFPHHHLMQELVMQMGLSLFPQYESGDVLYQFENIKAPRSISNTPSQKTLRIKDGAYSLVRRLTKNLDSKRLHAKHKVISVSKEGEQWRVIAKVDDTIVKTKSDHVIFALPPRVIARDFAKATWMNNVLEQQLKQSQTWMSAQSKIIITYSKPFWREKGFSGHVASQVGPIVEVYDACCSDDKGFALFGFIGIPATQRLREPQKELKIACLKQLADIFGHEAYRFEKFYIKDWAKDKEICTGQDQSEGSRHPQINMQTCESALLGENLYLAGSEFANTEAGYLEGALIAVNTAIKKLESRS
jgi:monoamine oxidase